MHFDEKILLILFEHLIQHSIPAVYKKESRSIKVDSHNFFEIAVADGCFNVAVSRLGKMSYATLYKSFHMDDPSCFDDLVEFLSQRHRLPHGVG